MQPGQKDNSINKPGIERLLFIAVGFEPATVHVRELYAPAGRRSVKVDIYISIEQRQLATQDMQPFQKTAA